MCETGDLIEVRKGWWWKHGLPPLEDWLTEFLEQEQAKGATDQVLVLSMPIDVGRSAYVYVPHNVPFVPPYFMNEPMPQNTPILVTNMRNLPIDRDPALVQFMYDGQPRWVRAACWEHVHADFHVISKFSEAIDA